ncbi:MAG: hypothetical protein HY565_00130 [Candidatus Kerfeldbacteria bacterium]|nr:hypothetical protein [Candidatus Kerfeldbacteria bacterium]
MKKLSLIVLVLVGVSLIAGLVWLYYHQPAATNETVNRPTTWTSDATNELVIVQLNPTDSDQYSVDLEEFGTVTFNAIGETQIVNQQQLKLVSATASTAQVLVSATVSE